ncbi:MAG: DUF116 domain-containing protein, partial [Methanocorpusculum sp.]|nr:DUF116 domain-containing protein [Methanocorpusculum sp.]
MSAIVPLAIFDNPVWYNIAIIIGEIVILLLLLWIVIAVVFGILIVISIKRKKMYFPSVMRPFFSIVEAGVKVVCLILGVDSTQLMEFLINIDNEMNIGDFSKIPVADRIIFFPQCLRNRDCPAHLTPDDGLKCVSCGRCMLGAVITVLKNAGYNVYIIPGSTFIKRMVRDHKPKAMIGVGCLMEVKEGLELGKKIHLTTIGVVTSLDGCVETTMDYDKLMEAAS